MTVRAPFYIDGAFVPGLLTGGREVTSSVDGHRLGTYPVATREHMDAAVAAARRALEPKSPWASMGAEYRAAAMESLAEALKSRVDQIGQLISHEVGSPIGLAKAANAVSAISQLRYYARVARSTNWEETRPARHGQSLVRRAPTGVVAAVVPWNFPIGLAAFKLGPALAAGCTVVLKPAPETALSSYLLAEAISRSDLPAGVVNVVPAEREMSEYLIAHPGVDKVSFTGSTATGRRVAALAGAELKPVTLELGGKSAAVLLPDADLDAFIEQLPTLAFMNNGQTCTINARILVPRSRSSEMTAAVVARVEGLRIGSPLEGGVEVGPLVSDRHRARVEEYIRIGVHEGASLLTSGRRPDGLASSTFVSPTVFADVTPGMRIAREEIFGPVVTIQEYGHSDDDAVTLANDSEFGLAGTVWSADHEHAVAVARRIHSGVVGANVWNLDHNAPFGGRKASGIGHELGPEAIDPYLVYQSIYTPRSPGDE